MALLKLDCNNKSIEFVGLSGAGKTTLRKELCKKFYACGLESYSSRSLFAKKAACILNLNLIHKARFFLEQKSYGKLFKLTKSLQRELFREFESKHLDYVRLCNDLIEEAHLPGKFKNKMLDWLEVEGAGWSLFNHFNINHENLIFFNDEGFLHRALTYFGIGKCCFSKIPEYVDLMPHHDRIFFIETPVDVVLYRRKKSINLGFNLLGVTEYEAQISYLNRCKDVMFEVKKYLQKNVYMCLDGEKSVCLNSNLAFRDMVQE